MLTDLAAKEYFMASPSTGARPFNQRQKEAPGMLSFDEGGQGGGKPLVLMHGWCCNRRHMAGLFQHFSKSRHVLAVDLPGHGQTPIEGTPPLLDAFAASLSGFLTEQSLVEAILVGHSMGGILSVLAAGQQSERIAGVVNLDGALPLTAPARAGYEELFARINAEGFRGVAARFVKDVFFMPHERGPLCEEIVEDMLSLPENLAVALMSQFPSLDAGKALTACSVPMLYIGGSYPRFDQATLARLQPHAWMARAAICGHFVQIFALPQVIAMIEKFLDLGITLSAADSDPG
jgi:pimeloyl-ACP methyl ester carboxylesterase